MLSLVEVRTNQGTLLSLPLEDISDGLGIADIDGIEPVDAVLVSSSFAGLDGEQEHSARRGKRNITMKLLLEPDYATVSVWDLRKRLYEFFMPKSQVNLRFYVDDDLTVNINAKVESCVPKVFAQQPEANISLICYDPNFVAMEPLELDGDSTSDSTETLIDYPGSIEAGFLFTFNIDRTVTEFTLYHRAPDNTLSQLDFAGSLEAGDVLTISTVPGSKFATLTRDGSDSSLVYAVSPQSSYVQLKPGGDNYIRVYATGDPIPYEITYTPLYGGL